MPLHDLFHPPLSEVHPWEGLHARWAVAVANDLNRRLPPRFSAVPQVHAGGRIEADVAEFDLDPSAPPTSWTPEVGGVATAAPPDATIAVDPALAVRYAVEIVDTGRARRLAGAVELVSPSNKDRPEHRRRFVAKCAGYLLDAVGLVVVDVVTERRANLHRELLALFDIAERTPADDADLYAVAYAPVPAGEKLRLDVWARPLAVGQPLPTLPLQVLALGRVQVDLDASYREACEWSRIPD
jgi:hypothetical protein